MIAKIKFEATVMEDKHESKMTDSISIHCPNDDVTWAKKIFSKWISANAGIRGDSGTFHPLAGFGDIKVKTVEIIKDQVKPKKEK
jgi:hypothetical protein